MEKFELVDKNGNKTGKIISEDELFYGKGLPENNYLQVAKLIIINNKNELLLQRRSALKRSKARRWGVCGGKVDMLEEPVDAAIRETFEEIGILYKKEDIKLLCNYVSGDGYFSIYFVKDNANPDDCILQKEEVEEVKYFKLEEISKIENEGFEWFEKLGIDYFYQI